MIAAARTTLAGSARRTGRGPITSPAEPADPAGLLLTRLTVLPALLVMAWLLAGLPLLLLGVFTPVLMLLLATPLAVLLAGAAAEVIRGIRRAGHDQPVLLAARSRELRPYGAAARRVMALHTTQDGHTLITPPRATWKLIINIWMSEPPR